jgi:tripartite-type tricarboxylate transporter receptor subunit TctC
MPVTHLIKAAVAVALAFPVSFASVLAGIAILTSGFDAHAQDYPTRPIKVIVGYGPGSTNDVRLRQISDRLAAALGQPIVIENRPGAAATLAAGLAAKAAPDGYTLLYGGATELAVEPALRKDLPYDVLRDFQPIVQLGTSPAVLFAGPRSNVRTFQDLVAGAKAKPGQLTCGSYGAGSLTHLLLMQLNQQSGIDLVHVPYKNPASGLMDVAGGHTTVAFDYMVGAASLLQAGKLVPLLVIGDTRLSVLPDVPSAAEVGLPGLDRKGWAGFLAPRNTPKDIVRKLNREIVRLIRSPEMTEVIARSGAQIVAGTPEGFETFIRDEHKKYAALVKSVGLRAE